MAQGAVVPVIDGESCVHGLAATARCSRCATACPANALHLGETSLGIDEDACTGCGHCRAACTESAISFEGVDFTPIIDTGAGEAFIACTKVVPDGGQGVIPCLHGMSEGDLSRLAGDRILSLNVARGACDGCTHKAAAGFGFEARLDAVNRLRASRGEEALAASHLTPETWRLQVKATVGRRLDPRRRSLFASFLRAAPAAASAVPRDPLARYSPVIDPSLCAACDACARICRHGAIELALDTGGLHYAVKPQNCSGCNLCIDVCESRAVTLAEFGPQMNVRVALREGRCVRCGAPFHETQGASQEHERCRICRGNTRHAKLFEVRS